MVDRLAPEERSANMRRIRSADTAPELIVRRAAHRLGYRFRLHRRDLPGTPDLAFSRLRKAIFVHGCFWHQHPACKDGHIPKSRLDYWLPKLRRNQERDKANLAALERLGWDVLVLWECEAASENAVAGQIEAFLTTPAPGRPPLQHST